MRVLLMISNSNMSVRELYGTVLRERHPGWGISNMSGPPINPATIMKGFDVVVYELGAADDPRRYRAVLALWDEVKELGTVRMITHIEGPYREGVVDELESQGVMCVGAPFTLEAIAEAFERVAPPRKEPATPKESGPGLGARLRGLLRRHAGDTPP
jgi:hypothetical protein